MKRYLVVMSLMLIPFLGGCVPNAVSYYRPTAEGGKIVTGTCVPIESVVDVPIGLITVRAGMSKQHVSLSLSRTWQTIQFSSDAFKIRDLKTNRVYDPRSIEVYRDDGSNALTVPYPQAGARGGRSFWIHVNLSDPIPESFELLSPPVFIDESRRGFPSFASSASCGWASVHSTADHALL